MRDLLAHGAEGLHFYTLNKSKATVDIVKALGATHAYKDLAAVLDFGELCRAAPCHRNKKPPPKRGPVGN